MKKRISIAVLIALGAALAQNAPGGPPLRIRVSEGVLYREITKKVAPSLPCSTDRAHQKGTVTVAVVVDADGKVKSTSRTDGDPVLAECAMRAINQWEFKPTLSTVRPSPSRVGL